MSEERAEYIVTPPDSKKEYYTSDATPEQITRFEQLVQPGTAVRALRPDGTAIEKPWHIRAIVDDTEIVIRVWSKQKKRWFYRVESRYYLWLYFRDGRLEKV